MVRLTTSFVEKKRLQQQLKKHLTKEVAKDELTKITHLFMNDQNIDLIDDFSACKNLKVIYLQKNCIEKIKNLDFATNLTHLYLQHNKIEKIENLGTLTSLKKLYLGSNNISVVEGLENLINLTELHVEKQRLPPGISLTFDIKSIRTLSICLKYLNISENQLISLNELVGLYQLVTLVAEDNLIEDLEDLALTVSNLVQIHSLSLQGNPVTKIYRYRENLIASSDCLKLLDDKSITEYSRTFLKKFRDEKFLQSQRKIKPCLSEDIASALNLPPAFSRSVSRAMFQNIEPRFQFSGLALLTDPQVFPSWTTAPGVKPLKANHILPRQLWKHKIKKPSQKKQTSKQNSDLTSILEIHK